MHWIVASPLADRFTSSRLQWVRWAAGMSVINRASFLFGNDPRRGGDARHHGGFVFGGNPPGGGGGGGGGPPADEDREDQHARHDGDRLARAALLRGHRRRAPRPGHGRGWRGGRGTPTGRGGGRW